MRTTEQVAERSYNLKIFDFLQTKGSVTIKIYKTRQENKYAFHMVNSTTKELIHAKLCSGIHGVVKEMQQILREI